MPDEIYCTTYCNKGHRVSDGKPVDHECYILPPAALAAEIAGDIPKAIALIQQGKIYIQWEERTLKPHKGINSQAESYRISETNAAAEKDAQS